MVRLIGISTIQKEWVLKVIRNTTWTGLLTPNLLKKVLNSTKPLAGISSILAILLVVSIAPTFNSGIITNDVPVADSYITGGYFTATLENWKGEVLYDETFDNLVPNEGLECISDLVFGTTECVAETTFNYIGIGTGVISPIDSDTALGAESGTCARVQDATPSMSTATTGERLTTFSVTFTGASCISEVYGEVGLFDQSTVGNMVATALLPNTVQLFNASDTLTVTYNVENRNN